MLRLEGRSLVVVAKRDTRVANNGGGAKPDRSVPDGTVL